MEEEAAVVAADAVDVAVAGDKYNFTHEPLTPVSLKFAPIC